MATTFGGKMRPSCAQVMGVALLFFFLFSASSMAQVCDGGGKSSWPELVGRDGSTAEAIIKAENPDVKIVVIVPPSSVSREFNCKRVIVYVNSNGIIGLVPRLG